MKTKLAIHLLANAIILALGYYWLSVPESKAMTLTVSIVLVLFAGVLAILTYAAALLYRGQIGFRSSWRSAVRNIAPLVLLAMFVGVIYALLGLWNSSSGKPALMVTSWLTLKMHIPVRPARVSLTFSIVLWLIRWMLIPALVLPLARATASRGWAGLRALRLPSLRLWIATPILLWLSLRAPLLIVMWVPKIEGFVMQSASFGARAIAAYLLFGIAWLALAFLTSGGTPRDTQPSTVGSP
jgi:hypothetical protein